MNEYRGTAVLLLDDGRELTATASLRKDQRGTWEGTLTVPDQSKPIEMMNLQQGILRTEHGECPFGRPDISDWLDSPAGRFQIRIEGNGDAPF